jgi:hypothetical protein
VNEQSAEEAPGLRRIDRRLPCAPRYNDAAGIYPVGEQCEVLLLVGRLSGSP